MHAFSCIISQMVWYGKCKFQHTFIHHESSKYIRYTLYTARLKRKKKEKKSKINIAYLPAIAIQ